MTRLTGTRPFFRFAIRLALCTAILPVPLVSSVLAQDNANAAAPTFPIDLAAGPLTTALNQLASQTGLQIAFDAGLTAGLTSSAIKGNMTADAAMHQLLSGSGLIFRYTGPRTVTLEVAAAASGDIQLQTLTVSGDQQTATGPVTGYVAQRSATATKTDTPLRETPQSVSVVTRDEMDARNVSNFSEALNYTSGVAAGGHGASGGIGGDTISIRGFGGDGTTGASENEFIDGLKLSGSGYVTSAFDPYMFERVEVLKGPASVLYGQSTPGGVVNMVSKRPTETAQGEAGFKFGNFDLFQGILDSSGPLDKEGKYLYRLAATGWDNDTQVDYSGRRRYAVAPSFTWKPNADTSFTLIASMQKDDFDSSPLNWLPTIGTVVKNPNGKISSSLYSGDTNYQEWNRDSYAIGYQVEHHINEVFTLRQNARYNNNRLDYAGVYINHLNADLSSATRSAFGMLEHSNDWTLDNQVQADFHTGILQHKILMGVDGQILRSDTNREYGSWSDINVFDPNNDQDQALPAPWRSLSNVEKQIGLYAQDQLKWDNLVLVLGGREDWASQSQTNRRTDETTKQTEQAFTWRGGLLYAFDIGLSPYASYSESFNPESGTDASGAALKPSTGQQYEVGVKFQPKGYDSFITLSAFDIRRQNVPTADPSDPSFSKQTGEIRSRGVELEGKASLTDGLDATLAYSFLDTKVTQSNDTATGLDGADVAVKGNRPVAVPKHTASAWLNYTFHEGNLAGLGIGGGARYVGSTYGDEANSYKVPDFLLFDAALRYDFSYLSTKLNGWIMQVNATNLADKEYVSSCVGVDRCYYGNRRTIVGTVKYTW